MIHQFAEVAVGIGVEAELDKVDVADSVDLLKEDAKIVLVGDVHLAMEEIEIVVLVGANFVEVVTMVEAVAVGCRL